jgi:hypothetical protein
MQAATGTEGIVLLLWNYTHFLNTTFILPTDIFERKQSFSGSTVF